MENKIALVNGRIYNGDDYFIGQALLIKGTAIHGIFPKHAIPEDYQEVDVQGAVICPGLIDLQIYGIGEDLFSNELSASAIARIDQQLLVTGCTSYFLTLATNTMPVFKEAIQVFKAASSSVAMGLHLEGPFLNPAKRGAHPKALILKASREHIAELLQDSGASVKMMTVAPELLDESCIDLLLQAGVLLSAGHSAATFAEGMAGFDKGIRATTHLWNAMSAFHHRETGLSGATFRHPQVKASIIVDGVHVDYEAVRMTKQLLDRRLFLITDAVASCSAGIYQHVRKENHYTLPDGTLSGSSLTLLKAIQNCVEHVGIALDEAIRMATAYPAALIERADIGNLAVGSKANVLIFNDAFEVQNVYLEGEMVV